MKHFGDITKIHGGKVPAVDVITFGAPCQDLSVAGTRHGMRHEALGDEETTRSGLFYEAVRIIKEMRDHDRSTGRAAELVCPRFAIYENVPGALSSNGGKDWQAVIQSLLQVVREVPDIPVPDRGWPSVGSFCGVGRDGVPFSLAYKQHDAQYWGVPQRRKRLSIVVDYAGFDAPWILFDPQFVRASENGEPHETVRDSGNRSESGEVRAQCEGLPGDTEPSGAPGQGAAAGAESGTGTAGFGETGIGYWQRGIQTLRAEGENRSSRPSNVILNGAYQAVDVYNQTIDGDIAGTVTAAVGGTNTSGCKVLSSAEPIPINTMVGTRDTEETRTTFGVGEPGDPQFTISAAHEHAVFTNAISFQERAGKPGVGKGILIQNERVGALITLNNQAVLDSRVTEPTAFGISSYDSNSMRSANPHSGVYKADTLRTLDLNGGSPACNQGGIAVVEPIMLQNNQNNAMIAQDGVSYTLPASAGMGGGYVPMIVEPTMIEMTSTKNTIIQDGTSCTLTARMGTGGNQVNAVCCDVGFFDSHNDKCGTLLARQYKDPPIVTETYQEQTGALCASGYNKNGTREAQNGMYVTGSTVRRLTPDECASLQGFPRWWCNIGEWTDSKGKLHKDADSPKYKAYGNSIAVGYDNDQSGFWCWLARRICAQYERRVTMASLFDGIGGFPLAFGAAGAIPVWASEIEEFPIAVTKIRFPEVEE